MKTFVLTLRIVGPFLLVLSLSPLLGQTSSNYWECYVMEESPPTPLHAPCPVTTQDSSVYGRALTPRGTQRSLIVFAGFKGMEYGGDPVNRQLHGWDTFPNTNYDLPYYLDFDPATNTTTTHPVFFNTEDDFETGGPIDDPTNKSASKIYNIMSKPNEDFRFIGEVFTDSSGVPVMVVVDPHIDPFTGQTFADSTDLPDTWFDMNRLVVQNMSLINPNFNWAQFDERRNDPGYQCDNSINPTPDGQVDYIIIVYKWFNNGNWNAADTVVINQTTGNPVIDIQMLDWQGSGGGFDQVGLGQVPFPTGDTVRFSAGFTIPKGAGFSRTITDLFVHEFAHSVYHCPHYFSSNNVVGSYMYKHASGWGPTAQSRTSWSFTAWDRWYLGYIDGIDVTQNGVYALRDFITTGDAIRIEIPNSGGQHLWIENHTGVQDLDDHPDLGEEIGPTTEVLNNSPNGIYMYLENIAGDRDTYGFGNVLISGANGTKFINASGNYDFDMDLSIPPETNERNDQMFRVTRKLENPIGGGNPMLRYRNDFDTSGTIVINQNNWNGGGIQETRTIFREFVGGVDKFLYRNYMADNEIITNYNRSPVFLQGDVVSMDSKHPVLNYASYSVLNRAFDPYFLNGLRIEIDSINPINGDAIIDIQFDHTVINKDLRWTGNIVVPDITNDTADLVLAPYKKLTLDIGGTTNRHTTHPQLGGFVNPTILTIDSAATLFMGDSSNLTIQSHSKLIIEDSAEVIMENGACIVIDSTGILEFRGNNITMNGPESVIIVHKGGTIMTADSVDLTFTGSGYISFDEGNIVQLGQGSNFILIRPLIIGAEKPRFIQLNNNATLNISGDHLLQLEYGEIQYQQDARIFAQESDVYLRGVKMSYDETNSVIPDGIIGLEGIDLVGCTIQSCEAYGIGTVLNIRGNTTSPGILYCRMENCMDGIIADDFDYISIIDNDFLGIENTAAKLSNVDISYNYLNKIEEYNDVTPITGYDLDNVGMALFNNGWIKDCTTGIAAFQSNVLIRDGALIENNQYGVLFENNTSLDFSLTVGDYGCAQIINNSEAGIKGDNIILNIDAIEHAVNNGDPDEVLPNRFDGNEMAFDICYTDTAFVNTDLSPVLMKANYWGGGGFISTNSSFTRDFPNNPPCKLDVIYDDSQYPTTVPANCDFIQIDDPGGMPTFPDATICQLEQDSVTVYVHEQNRLAFVDLREENYLAAKSKYQPIADLTEEELEGEAATCLHKMYYARTIVEAIPDNFNPLIFLPDFSHWDESVVRKKEEPVRKNVFKLTPNPARDFINIKSLVEGTCELTIYNALGQVMKQTIFSNDMTLNVNELKEGIYFVDIINRRSKVQFQQKLIVQ